MVFNTDRWRQFTSEALTDLLERDEGLASMRGRERHSNNMFEKHLWRTVKLHEVYLQASSGGKGAKGMIDAYLGFDKFHRSNSK